MAETCIELSLVLLMCCIRERLMFRLQLQGLPKPTSGGFQQPHPLRLQTPV